MWMGYVQKSTGYEDWDSIIVYLEWFSKNRIIPKCEMDEMATHEIFMGWFPKMGGSLKSSILVGFSFINIYKHL